MHLSGYSVLGNITSLNTALQCKTHSQLGMQNCSFCLNSNKMWWYFSCWSAQGSVSTLQDQRRHPWCCGENTQGNGMRLESRRGRWSSKPFGLGSKSPFFCGDRIRITQSSLRLCSLVAAVSDDALQSERQPETWCSFCILPFRTQCLWKAALHALQQKE